MTRFHNRLARLERMLPSPDKDREHAVRRRIVAAVLADPEACDEVSGTLERLSYYADGRRREFASTAERKTIEREEYARCPRFMAILAAESDA